MAKIILRQEAIDDLNAIWFYTYEKGSERQADYNYAALEFACKQIGNNPEPGKEYEEINSNLRGLRTGKHIIFYQVIANDEIEIVRTLHEQMNLKGRLNK